MSGAQTSTFADPNILLRTLSGQQTADVVAQQQANQLNQLMMPFRVQEAQQTVGNNEAVAMAQASQGLLSLPDEASRAAAYPGVVRGLRQQGFAMSAPEQYPGEQVLQLVRARGMPVEQQYNLGLATAPGLTSQIQTIYSGGGAAPGGGGGAATAGGGGTTTVTPSGTATIGQRQNNPGNLTFAGQPYATQVQGNRFAAFPDMPTGVAANADQLALYQTQHGINTVSGAVDRWVSDPKADLTSYKADIAKALGVGINDPIDLTDPNVQAKFIQAQFPHESAGGGYVLNPADVQKGVQMAAARRGQQVQPTPTPSVAVTAPSGATTISVAAGPRGGAVARNPGSYNVATTAPVPPPGGAVAAPTATTAPPLAPQNALAPGAPGAPPAPSPPPAAPQAPAAAPPPPAATPSASPAQLPTQSQAPASPSPQSNLPRAADVPSGMNAPQVQQAQALLQRATQIATLAARAPGDKVLQSTAAAQIADLKARAQVLMQTDSIVQTQEGQLHSLTGQIDKAAAPLPVWQQRPDGTWVDVSGGGADPKIAPSPRFVEGTATWDGQKWVPTSPGQQGTPGRWSAGGGVAPTFYPAATRPPTGSYSQQAEAYKTDIPVVQAATTAGQTAQNSLIQLNELAGLVGDGRISSGPEGPFRSKVAAYMEQHGFSPEVIKSWTGMSSGSDAQLLQKLATATVGASAKADLGSNVGIQSLELYQNANPGITMLDDANKRVTNMIRVARALTDDYTVGLQKHFNANQDSFLHDGSYNEPVSVYNAKWQQQNNPQVGAAAIGILNGDDYSSWASRLGSPDEAFRAAQLVARIDPNAMVKTAAGLKPVKDILAHQDAPGSNR